MYKSSLTNKLTTAFYKKLDHSNNYFIKLIPTSYSPVKHNSKIYLNLRTRFNETVDIVNFAADKLVHEFIQRTINGLVPIDSLNICIPDYNDMFPSIESVLNNVAPNQFGENYDTLLLSLNCLRQIILSPSYKERYQDFAKRSLIYNADLDDGAFMNTAAHIPVLSSILGVEIVLLYDTYFSLDGDGEIVRNPYWKANTCLLTSNSYFGNLRTWHWRIGEKLLESEVILDANMDFKRLTIDMNAKLVISNDAAFAKIAVQE